jgi:hypothetical protein
MACHPVGVLYQLRNYQLLQKFLLYGVNYKICGAVLSSKLSNALSNSMERKLNMLNNAYKSKLERYVYQCGTIHTNNGHTNKQRRC